VGLQAPPGSIEHALNQAFDGREPPTGPERPPRRQPPPQPVPPPDDGGVHGGPHGGQRKTDPSAPATPTSSRIKTKRFEIDKVWVPGLPDTPNLAGIEQIMNNLNFMRLFEQYSPILAPGEAPGSDTFWNIPFDNLITGVDDNSGGFLWSLDPSALVPFLSGGSKGRFTRSVSDRPIYRNYTPKPKRQQEKRTPQPDPDKREERRQDRKDRRKDKRSEF
jgi:hypothetical protein